MPPSPGEPCLWLARLRPKEVSSLPPRPRSHLGVGSSGRSSAHSASVMSVGLPALVCGPVSRVALRVREAITRWGSRVGLAGHRHGRLRHWSLLPLYGFDTHELCSRPCLHALAAAWPRQIIQPGTRVRPPLLKIEKTTAS